MKEILTPFKYDVIFLNENGESTEEPYMNYEPYKLFVLKTRLRPFINKYLGKDYDIYYGTVRNNNEMVLTVKPILGSKPVPLGDKLTKLIQDQVNILTQSEMKHAMIFSSDSVYLDHNNHIIPSSWISSIVRFIPDISKDYNPQVKAGDIYADLSNVDNYTHVKNELNEHILDKIREFYKDGYIVDGESITDEWGLTDVHQNFHINSDFPLGRLWKPQWICKEITEYPVDFLRQRISGNKILNLRLGNNNVDRHFIALELNKINKHFYFQDETLRVESDNLSDALSMVSLINHVKSYEKGKVVTLKSNRISWINTYNILSENIFQLDAEHPELSKTHYVIKDTITRFVFSHEIDLSQYGGAFSDELELKTRNFMLGMQKKYGDNFQIHLEK